MATVVKQFSFNAASEGWTFNAGGGTGLSGTERFTGFADSSNDPNPGDAANLTSRSGKNLSNGTPYWEWAGSWEDLGVPSGSTVTAVDLSYDWQCPSYVTGASSTTGPAELRDDATAVRGTFLTATAFTSTTAWATRTGAQIAGLSDASTELIRLRIGAKPNTGSSNSAQVNLLHDWIVVTVTYSAGGAAAEIPILVMPQMRAR